MEDRGTNSRTNPGGIEGGEDFSQLPVCRCKHQLITLSALQVINRKSVVSGGSDMEDMETDPKLSPESNPKTKLYFKMLSDWDNFAYNKHSHNERNKRLTL